MSDEALLEGRAEEDIKLAILEASKYPLSIIFIGVGDGNGMNFQGLEEKFCARLPGQMFHNFGFVNYTHCSKSVKNFEQRQIPFIYQILRLVAVHYTNIQSLYHSMLSMHHQRCCVRDTDSGMRFSDCKNVLSELPKELLDADKSYKKRFSPLSTHIRKKSTATSVETEEAEIHLSNIQETINSIWSDDEFIDSPALDNFSSPPSAPCMPSNSVSRKESLPPIFVCPITQEMMRDPVIAEDGYTYERQAIEEWTSRHRRSPMTNKDMNTTQLISNHALRSAISSHMDKYAYSH